MTSGVKRSLEEIAAYKAQILEYLGETPGGTFFGACAKLKVGYSTGNVWLKDDPDWRAEIDVARKMADAVGGDFAEGKLMNCIQQGEFPAIKYYLGTKHKNRGYVERQEQTGAEGGPIQTKAEVAVAHDLEARSLEEIVMLFTDRLKS